MNIFVLNTGRCGSTTFIRACRPISNFTSAHESLATQIGKQRLAYPVQHIEADNRLSWLLGRLEREYGDRAWYVHLSRDTEKTADSFSKRGDLDTGIMKAYRKGILLGGEDGQTTRDIALDYIDTVESNIQLFLRDKTHVMNFRLETAKADFRQFWEWIGAKGDQGQALAEWDTAHNASAG